MAMKLKTKVKAKAKQKQKQKQKQTTNINIEIGKVGGPAKQAQPNPPGSQIFFNPTIAPSFGYQQQPYPAPINFVQAPSAQPQPIHQITNQIPPQAPPGGSVISNYQIEKSAYTNNHSSIAVNSHGKSLETPATQLASQLQGHTPFSTYVEPRVLDFTQIDEKENDASVRPATPPTERAPTTEVKEPKKPRAEGQPGASRGRPKEEKFSSEQQKEINQQMTALGLSPLGKKETYASRQRRVEEALSKKK